MDSKDKEHELEQWLDVALAQYSNAEPRTGMEGRILANLWTEKDRMGAQRRWWWTAGTIAAAAVVMVTVWLGGHHTRRIPNRAAGHSTTQSEDAAAAKHIVPPVIQLAQGDVKTPRRRTKAPVATPAKEPRLDQFPSPVPLTDQEKMLARYVQEFPQRAVLVARAQTQLRKQEEREMATPPPGSAGPTSSDQPE